MSTPVKNPPCPVPRRELALVGLQVVLASIALGLDLVEACGACTRTTPFHMAIAAVGVASYLALLALGATGFRGLFYTGIFVAGGIHTALLLWMMETQSFCLPCVASTAVALALIALAIRSGRPVTRLVERAFLPALLLTGGVCFASEAIQDARKEAWVREALPPREATISPEDGPAPARPVTVAVFEQDHCPYCREFRERYLPRLEHDFGPKIAVRFLPVEAGSWVRRTPTIAIESGPVFDGLPRQYEDLRRAVEETLATRR